MDTRAGIRRAGFLLEGEKQWAIGADFGIEGKQADRTGGRVDEESGLSFNLLVGIAAVETEHWRVVPLGLVGAINPTHHLSRSHSGASRRPLSISVAVVRRPGEHSAD